MKSNRLEETEYESSNEQSLTYLKEPITHPRGERHLQDQT